MAIVGYARVSSIGQSLDIQIEQLTEAGCEKVFAEKQSGTSTTGRTELSLALDWVREGDVFVITRLDRLARSITDLWDIVRKLDDQGVSFRCIQQPVDTTTPAGRLMISMLGAFAEFETELRRERQAEGIARAKAEGKYSKPRKPQPSRISAVEIRRLRDVEKLGAAAIAKRLKCSRVTVYRKVPDGWGTATIKAKS